MARDDVARTWLGLETWARTNLPGILAELNGPAEPRVVARLEATLGFALPADFRTSVGVHDGETGDGALLDSGGALLSIRAIGECAEWERTALRKYADLEAELLRGPAKGSLYAWHRVPIVDFNQDLTWFLDLDPAPGGAVGQVLRRDVEDGALEVVAPSFAQFFADYLHRLETGHARFPAHDLDNLRQAPPDRSALNARLQRFSQALRDQRGLDLGCQPDGSEVHVVGSLAPPTPGMAPDEYPFMMGTIRVILRCKLGLSPQDIMAGNMRGDLYLYRVRGLVRRRPSRHGRDEITLELKSFETFD
jgi:cell wall assembly regulator SMI1